MCIRDSVQVDKITFYESFEKCKTTAKQCYKQSMKAIKLLCFTLSKMGNSVETDCLPHSAQNGILAIQ